MSVSAGPTGGIWKKWSITQRLAKPPASAASAIARRRPASAALPPGHVKFGIWSPSRMASSSSPRLYLGSAARVSCRGVPRRRAAPLGRAPARGARLRLVPRLLLLVVHEPRREPGDAAVARRRRAARDAGVDRHRADADDAPVPALPARRRRRRGPHRGAAHARDAARARDGAAAAPRRGARARLALDPGRRRRRNGDGGRRRLRAP